MIEAEIVKQFIGQEIEFSWKSTDKIFFSYGKLLEATGNSICVLFQNKRQIYTLESLQTIRERLQK